MMSRVNRNLLCIIPLEILLPVETSPGRSIPRHLDVLGDVGIETLTYFMSLYSLITAFLLLFSVKGRSPKKVSAVPNASHQRVSSF